MWAGQTMPKKNAANNSKEVYLIVFVTKKKDNSE
jgi:hypothetical protein